MQVQNVESLSSTQTSGYQGSVSEKGSMSGTIKSKQNTTNIKANNLRQQQNKETINVILQKSTSPNSIKSKKAGNNYETVHLENAMTGSSVFTCSADNDETEKKRATKKVLVETITASRKDRSNKNDMGSERSQSQASETMTQGSLPNTIVGTIRNDKIKGQSDAKSSQEKRRSHTLNTSSFAMQHESNNESQPMLASFEKVQE